MVSKAKTDTTEIEIFLALLSLPILKTSVVLISPSTLMIRGAFMTRVVISLLIAFAAIITFEVIMKFSFFKERKEKVIEGDNNDKQQWY